jgi:hypothetical protein
MNTPKPRTALGKKLVKAGYQIIREVGTRPFSFGSFVKGRWYEVVTPDGMAALFLKQGNSCFHTFGVSEWTASGSNVESAYNGGLGDAIGTDAQMRTYVKMVKSAPDRLTKEYAGLYAAQSQVING